MARETLVYARLPKIHLQPELLNLINCPWNACLFIQLISKRDVDCLISTRNCKVYLKMSSVCTSFLFKSIVFAYINLLMFFVYPTGTFVGSPAILYVPTLQPSLRA